MVYNVYEGIGAIFWGNFIKIIFRRVYYGWNYYQ